MRVASSERTLAQRSALSLVASGDAETGDSRCSGCGFECLDRCPVSAELERFMASVVEGRAHVGGNEVSVIDSLEAVLFQDFCVLSIQESSCDSASPEIDVPLAFL